MADMLTEAEILEDVIRPGRAAFPAEAAASILNLGFSRKAQTRIRHLLRANNRGRITDADRAELDRFMRVGQLIDLLQASARTSLNRRKAG